jgi:hypothetical protein
LTPVGRDLHPAEESGSAGVVGSIAPRSPADGPSRRDVRARTPL